MSFKKSVSHFRLSGEGCISQWWRSSTAQTDNKRTRHVITATFLKACLNLSSASACIIFERLSLSADVILKLYENSRKQVWVSHLQPTNTLQSKNPAKMALRLCTFWLSISVSSWESSKPFFNITECLCSGSTLLLNGMREADLIVHDWKR